MEPLFTCTTCGSCEVQCLAPHREHIVDVIEEIRAQAVEVLGPLERHQKFRENIEQHHNPYGEQHHAREMKEIHNLPDKAEYVYFIGCTANYRETKIRDATISLLKKADIDFTVVDEFCCSSPMIRTGQRSLSPDLAKHNITEIEKAGAKRIITSCSGCYRTMRRDYLNIGLEYSFEVLHTTELFEEFLDNGKLTIKSSEDTSYTWHDPCHLGRHMNVFEAPRNLMSEAGINYNEFDQNRENAWCCGAGGGARAAFSEWSLLTAETRVAQAKGSNHIVTACPFCVKNLRDGSKNEVVDLVEILDRIT
jgi:Fe-S oxidoreductase